MNSRDAEKVGRLIVGRETDFCVVRNLSIVVPILSILRGFLIESSSAGSNYFYCWIFLMPLYVPTKNMWLNLGKRIRSGSGTELWDAAQSGQLEQLRSIVAGDGLSVLRRISSPREIIRVGSALGIHRSLAIEEAVAYSLVYDRQTREAVEALTRMMDRLDVAVYWQAEIAERANLLMRLLQSDPARALLQLREWETSSIEALKLGKCTSAVAV